MGSTRRSNFRRIKRSFRRRTYVCRHTALPTTWSGLIGIRLRSTNAVAPRQGEVQMVLAQARAIVMKTANFRITGLFNGLDHLAIEKRLRRLQGVRDALMNPASESASGAYAWRVST